MCKPKPTVKRRETLPPKGVKKTKTVKGSWTCTEDIELTYEELSTLRKAKMKELIDIDNKMKMILRKQGKYTGQFFNKFWKDNFE